MRKFALSLASLAMMLPSTAMACHHAQASSVNVSCEQGVRVYRATPLAAPAAPIVIVKRANNNNFSVQRAILQSERLAAQAERIDTLESRLEETNRPRRRIYSAPVGAFGSGAFVRRRGFKNRRRAGAPVFACVIIAVSEVSYRLGSLGLGVGQLFWPALSVHQIAKLSRKGVHPHP